MTPAANAQPSATPITAAAPATATPTTVLPPTATPLATLASPTSFTDWKDRDGRVQLRYPADWTAAPPPSAQSQAALFVRGKTAEITFAVTLMPQRGSDADAIADASLCRNRVPSCPAYQYRYGQIEETTVGGVAGKFRRFSSFYRSDAAGGSATQSASGTTTEMVWVINRSGQTFIFHAAYFGEGRGDIEAIVTAVITTVTFLQ